MEKFWICFVPLFVAVDALGTLPIYMGMVQGLERRRVRRVLAQSLLTAIIVAVSFLALGTGFLQLLGITVADFMVAGGVLLFVIAMADLLSSTRAQGVGVATGHDIETVGAVPLGVPLIAGPALLTTSLLLLQQHGFWPTGSAIVVNIAIAGALFFSGDFLGRLLGKAGSKIISKISNLLLAAVAVMIVRKGIVMIFTQAFTGTGHGG